MNICYKQNGYEFNENDGIHKRVAQEISWSDELWQI